MAKEKIKRFKISFLIVKNWFSVTLCYNDTTRYIDYPKNFTNFSRNIIHGLGKRIYKNFPANVNH